MGRARVVASLQQRIVARLEEIERGWRRVGACAGRVLDETDGIEQRLREVKRLVKCVTGRTPGPAPRLPAGPSPSSVAQANPIRSLVWNPTGAFINDHRPQAQLPKHVRALVEMLVEQPAGPDGFPRRLPHNALGRQLGRRLNKRLTDQARRQLVYRLKRAFTEAGLNPWLADSDRRGVRLLVRLEKPASTAAENVRALSLADTS